MNSRILPDSFFKRKSYFEVSVMAIFKGKTQNVPFLPASFWKRGTQILGRVLRGFHTENGTAYVLKLGSPVELDGKQVSLVCIGALRGFEMALVGAGLERLCSGDLVALECIGSTPSTKGSPRVDFEIEVTREPSPEITDEPSPEITDEDVPF